MRQLCADPYGRIFNFYEITNFNIIFDNSIRSQMNIRTHFHVIFYLAFLSIGKLNMVAIAYFYILQSYIRSDFTIFPDFSFTL